MIWKQLKAVKEMQAQARRERRAGVAVDLEEKAAYNENFGFLGLPVYDDSEKRAAERERHH